jgi:hypothetical protein
MKVIVSFFLIVLLINCTEKQESNTKIEDINTSLLNEYAKKYNAEIYNAHKRRFRFKGFTYEIQDKYEKEKKYLACIAYLKDIYSKDNEYYAKFTPSIYLASSLFNLEINNQQFQSLKHFNNRDKFIIVVKVEEVITPVFIMDPDYEYDHGIYRVKINTSTILIFEGNLIVALNL